MRTFYDQSRTWQKHPAEVEAALPEEGTHITITEARRIIEGITGKVSGGGLLQSRKDQTTEAQETPGPAQPLPVPASPAPDREDEAAAPTVRGKHQPTLAMPLVLATRSPGKPQPTSRQATLSPRIPVFLMELPDGWRGALVTARHTGTKGVALLTVDGEEVSVTFAEVRPVDVG